MRYGCSRAVLNKMHIYKFILCPLVVLICMHRQPTPSKLALLACSSVVQPPSPSPPPPHTAHRLYIVILITPTANFVYCIVLLGNILGNCRNQPKAQNTTISFASVKHPQKNIQNRCEHKFRKHMHRKTISPISCSDDVRYQFDHVVFVIIKCVGRGFAAYH